MVLSIRWLHTQYTYLCRTLLGYRGCYLIAMWKKFQPFYGSQEYIKMFTTEMLQFFTTFGAFLRLPLLPLLLPCLPYNINKRTSTIYALPRSIWISCRNRQVLFMMVFVYIIVVGAYFLILLLPFPPTLLPPPSPSLLFLLLSRKISQANNKTSLSLLRIVKIVAC